jgi:hypothetical protein
MRLASELDRRAGSSLRRDVFLPAGEVLLTFQVRWASIGVWDVRGKGPDRVRAGTAINYEQVFRDVAPGLWRTIYAVAAGRRAVADEAVAGAVARAGARRADPRPGAPDATCRPVPRAWPATTADSGLPASRVRTAPSLAQPAARPAPASGQRQIRLFTHAFKQAPALRIFSDLCSN